jgi:hypothetical protein
MLRRHGLQRSPRRQCREETVEAAVERVLQVLAAQALLIPYASEKTSY